ncbi:MAG: hypothetical protein KBC88_06630, partial [Alphaproteobacteria bacterium]|nr:hypothetical protein [Alphaproteobacteria bacterium]
MSSNLAGRAISKRNGCPDSKKEFEQSSNGRAVSLSSPLYVITLARPAGTLAQTGSRISCSFVSLVGGDHYLNDSGISLQGSIPFSPRIG